jgi:hypothetical protein
VPEVVEEPAVQLGVAQGGLNLSHPTLSGIANVGIPSCALDFLDVDNGTSNVIASLNCQRFVCGLWAFFFACQPETISHDRCKSCSG